MSPPIARASIRQMWSPRPVPPRRAAALPTWTYGRASFCRSSSLMPQPVSFTDRRNTPFSPGSPGSNEARSSTNPFFVNFKALPIRLNAICLSLCGSTISCGTPSASQSTLSPGALCVAANERVISPTSFATSVGSGAISIRPDSSFDRSRMSFTSWRSVRLLIRIEFTARSRSDLFSRPFWSISEKPMMALSGVRMSWLTVEKNRFFAFSRASAFSLAISSSSCRRRCIM